MLEMATNFSIAVAGWVRAGCKVVSEEVYRLICGICDPCGFWDPKSRGGLGKCLHRDCGCTVFKRYLRSSACPVKKWDAGRMMAEWESTRRRAAGG